LSEIKQTSNYEKDTSVYGLLAKAKLSNFFSLQDLDNGQSDQNLSCVISDSVYLSNEKENRGRIGDGGELDVKEGRAVSLADQVSPFMAK